MLAELDAVHRLARHLVRRGESVSVDDVVQETYLRALEGLKNFTLDAELGVRPWLFRILHHVVIRRATKERRDRQRELEVAREEPGADEFAWTELADLQVDWDNVDERLAAAIAELEEPLHSTFLLLAAGELSYKEIALSLEIPIGTVMSRIARARRRLIVKLAGLSSERRRRSADGREAPGRREARESIDG